MFKLLIGYNPNIIELHPMEVRTYRDVVLYQNEEALPYSRRYQAIRLAEQILSDNGFFKHTTRAEANGYRQSILSIDVVLR